MGIHKGVLLFILAGVAVLLLANPSRAEDASGELTLKPVSGKAVADILTPQRMLTDGKKVQFQGASGALDVGGKSYKVVGSYTKGRYYLAVDGNGDEKLDRNEIHPILRQNNAILVNLDSAEEESAEEPADDADTESTAKPRSCMYVLDNITMPNRNGKIAVIAFTMYPAWGMQTDYLGTKITLIDTNMDGRFTQEGFDAIAVGSKVAVPLKKIHRIGEGIFALTVREDGTEMSLKAQLDEKLGAIQLKKSSPLWKALIVTSDDGAFNVLQDGKKGLPADTYRVVCGMLSRGKEAAYISDPPNEEIQLKAGKKLALQIGLPARLKFQAATSRGSVNISPRDISVVGAAGEKYRFNIQMRSLPVINFVVGKRVVKRDQMGYG